MKISAALGNAFHTIYIQQLLDCRECHYARLYIAPAINGIIDLISAGQLPETSSFE